MIFAKVSFFEPWRNLGTWLWIQRSYAPLFWPYLLWNTAFESRFPPMLFTGNAQVKWNYFTRRWKLEQYKHGLARLTCIDLLQGHQNGNIIACASRRTGFSIMGMPQYDAFWQKETGSIRTENSSTGDTSFWASSYRASASVITELLPLRAGTESLS